ncbi:MAG: hypothetical protein E7299_04995 [Lachnospiraceae bacterium]|nr:hypothetical protein [Lachnospiraceae bacterium]
MAENNNYGPNYIGNVIRIVDSRTILVDSGNNKLKKDTYIQIYELGPEIYSHTGASLGNYEFVKDTLKVIEVTNRYSVCQKQDTRTIIKPSQWQLTLSPLLSESSETEYVPLKLEEKDIEPLNIKDPYIRVGDPIKLA